MTFTTHKHTTVIMVRHRKIHTALTTNQIAGFVTVASWKNMELYVQSVACSNFAKHKKTHVSPNSCLVFLHE